MYKKIQYFQKIISLGIVLFVSVSASLVFSDENRHVIVDQAVGEMEQGRRISSPGNYNNKGIASGNPGNTSNVADAHVHPLQAGVNHGYLYSGSNSTTPTGNSSNVPTGAEHAGTTQSNGSTNTVEQTGGSGNTGTQTVQTSVQTGSSEIHTGSTNSGATTQGSSGTTSNPIVATETNTNSSSGTPTATIHTDTSSHTAPAGPTSTVETTTGNGGVLSGGSTGGTTTQEQPPTSNGSSNPIVGVEANTNPSSGTPTVTVHTDTSGQLEDRQVINAGTTGTVTSGTQTGSASSTTGSETVHETNVTTQPITTTTGQTTPQTTNTGTTHPTVETIAGNGGVLPGGSAGATTQEPSSGGSSNPIVGIEANTNPSSGTPTVIVHADTSGQLEDRQIVSAGVIGGGTSLSRAQTGSVSSTTGSETVHETNVTTQPVTTTTGHITPQTTTTATTGTISTVETNAGNGGVLPGGLTGTAPQEQPGSTSNPIVGVEANTNPSSGTPIAIVHTDTSGQLEDRQVVNAGVAGTSTTQAQTGSASSTTGSETIHETNVTTQPVVGTTDHTIPETTTVHTGTTSAVETTTGNGGILPGGSTGTSTQEPSTGGSNNPIVGVEANTNSGSTPTAVVHTDTSGQLEDRQVVNAGVTGTNTTHTQTGSASSTTGSETVHEINVTTQPVPTTTGHTTPETTTTTVATGTIPTVETTTGNGGVLPGGSTGTTAQESPSGGSTANPIIGVEANTNPSSGIPTAAVHTDTSGQLEDRQVVDAGITGEGTGSTAVEVGSATDVTGQELVHEADITTGPVSSATGQNVTEQTSGSVNVGAGGNFPVNNSGTATPESSGTTSNPIVAVEADTNPSSGMPTAGVTVDTTGEIEDRQILQTDLAAEGITSGIQTGSTSSTTGSETVYQTNVTTHSVTGTTGQTGGVEAQTAGSGSSTTTQESSGSSSNPIVGVQADTSSGTPTVTVHTDTSGQLEDRRIFDAGVAGAGAGSTGTEIGSASGITGSGTVGSLDITTHPVESLISAPSDFGADVDTTGQTVGGEADIGMEADVSGISGGSDVGSEPAAGLTSGTTVKTGL